MFTHEERNRTICVVEKDNDSYVVVYSHDTKFTTITKNEEEILSARDFTIQHALDWIAL